MDRRNFLKVALAGAAAGLGARGALPLARGESEPRKEPAVLNLGSQEERIPGRSLREKVERLQAWGASGLEVAGNAPARIQEIKDALRGTTVRVSAVCAGYFSLIDPDPEKRKEGARRLADMLSVAGELEAVGVIVVPAANNHPQLDWEEGRKVLADLLPAVGEHAVACGTRVLLEPLNRDEARFLNRLEQAADICKAVQSAGIAMMGDFYHMAKEEADDEAAFLAAGDYCHHIHLASRQRNLPGQDDRSFVAGFRGLKKIGYRDYCSLECGVQGESEVEIPKSLEFLRSQWAEAKT